MGKRALLIVNPQARQGGQMGDAVRHLRERGLDLLEETSRDKRHLVDVVRRCRDVDLVIVGGGDGTLNAVADVLVEQQLPLGILPLGTANDLARTLGIPANLPGAADIIAAGNTRRIDLGWVNGKHFFNVASLGLSVQISRRLSRELKGRWGVFAYAATACQVLWNARPFHVEILAGAERQRVRTVQIAIGNGHYYGGGMVIATDAAIDDGRLDLYSLEVTRWWQLVPLLPALRIGTLESWSQARTLRGTEFEIHTRRPRAINTDGEITTTTPALFKVVPGALTVFAPGRGG